MGLLDGLEKFGFHQEQEIDITKPLQEEKQEPVVMTQKEEPKETDFLLMRNYVCPVCDYKFKAIAIRGTKLRRLEPDHDLRPRCQYVDVIKYDTVFCHNCGYAAMGNYFEPLSAFQIRRLKEQVQAKFVNKDREEKETYTFEEAIDRYKLCLVSAMVKNAKLSEKSYICLKIAWLYRDMYEEMSDHSKEDIAKKKAYKEQYDAFYKQAYSGFSQVLSAEAPPYCGMKTQTLEYLLANMAAYFGDHNVAARFISVLLTSPATSEKMKDRLRDLKEEIKE